MKKLFEILTLTAAISTNIFVPAVSYAEYATDGDVIYVSPNGSNGGDGSESNPLKSLEAARKRVQAMDKDKPITVIFKGGTYYFEGTGSEFTSKDSGREGNVVTYKAAEGEKVVFTGRKELDVSKFKPVTDKKTLERIPESARGDVASFDLKANGISLPKIKFNGNNAVDNYTMLTIDGMDQMLAQYPNGDTHYTQWKDIISKGSTSLTGEGGVIKYAGNEGDHWVTAKDAVLGGYPGYDYQYSFVPIKKVDRNKKTITLANGVGIGFMNSESKRYKVFNLLEELDVPGEWYIDRDEMKLYYYPPRNLKDTTLALSVFNDSFVNFTGTEYVRFEGIDFEQTMADAVEINKNSKGIEFVACGFKNLSRNAIKTNAETGFRMEHSLSNYNNAPTEIKITDCTFENIGSTAIDLFSGERSELVPGNSLIQNNYITDCPSLTLNAVTIDLKGVNNVVDHNTIHNTRFHAVNFQQSNDCIISNNEFYNVGRENYDAAVIYNGRSFLVGGTKVTNNYFHDWLKKDPLIGYDIVGIFLDDQVSGIEMYNNLFVNGEAGIQIGGGHNCIATGNVFGEIRSNPFNTDNRGETWAGWTEILPAVERMAGKTKFMEHYPWIATAMADYRPPKDNVITGNIADKEMTFNERVVELGTVENNLTVDKDSFVDPDNGDYRLKADSEAAKLSPEAPNENNFDLKEKGVQQNGVTRFTQPNEENSKFRKLYPQNGAMGIDPLRADFMWEKAPHADEYVITIATDPEMKNVVLQEKSDFNYFTATNLSAGNKSYYWTVEAVNISAQYQTKWKCSDVPFLITTTKYEILDKEELEANIKSVSEFYETIVEGTEMGSYQAGTKAELEKAIETAKEWASRSEGAATQKQIDNQAKAIKTAQSKALAKQLIGYSNINWAFEEGKREDGPGATVTNDGETVVVKKNPQGSGLMHIYSTDTLSNSSIQCFKMKLDWGQDNAWFGFDMRLQDKTTDIWSSSGYLICVKKDKIEVQRFPGGVLYDFDNTFIKDGEWVAVQYGVLNGPDCARMLFNINGVDIVDYTDDASNHVEAEGYMGIGFYTANDATALSIQRADFVPEGAIASTQETKTREYVGSKKLLSDKDNWMSNGGELNKTSDSISFKGKDKTVYYKPGLEDNQGVDMRVKFNCADSYQTVSLRSVDPTAKAEDNDNYLLKVSKDTISLERYIQGKYEKLAAAKNEFIPDGETVSMKLAAVGQDKYVQLVLLVNDKEIFNFVDMNALKATGALAFTDVSGKGIEIKAQSGGGTIETAPYEEKSDLMWKTDDCEISGEWTDAKSVGVNGLKTKETTQEGAVQKLEKTFSGRTYDVYFWNTISENGDENVTVTVEAGGDSGPRSTVVNQRHGTSGWKYLGAYYPSDGRVFVTAVGTGKGTFTAGAVKMVARERSKYDFSMIFEEVKKPVIIRTNSKQAFIGKEEKRLEQPPIIVNNKTLVPVRFLSEAFGAEVTWDGTKAQATVKKDDKTLVFTLNKSEYKSNGEVKVTEQSVTIKNNRLLVPLRVISEEFGKQLFWDDRGLIVLYDEGTLDAKKNADIIEGIASSITIEEE